VLYVSKLFIKVLILGIFRVFFWGSGIQIFFFLSCMKLGEVLVVSSRQSKLTPEQCFLNFILYMKHDNVIKYDASMWNWFKSTLCDDALFIASFINNALVMRSIGP